MLLQSLRYFVFLCLIAISISCNNDNFNKSRVVNRQIPSDFVKDIPVNTNGRSKNQLNFFYKNINNDAYLLNLDSLEVGYDSLQLRIWLGHSMAIKRHLVVLKYTNRKWEGYLIAFTTDVNNVGEYIASKNVKRIVPKSGWNRFSKNLLNMKILTLPDESSLQEYNGCAGDGNPFYFEVATTKKYRFYTYCNPQGNAEKYWQARNVINIVNFLEKEFDFQYTK